MIMYYIVFHLLYFFLFIFIEELILCFTFYLNFIIIVIQLIYNPILLSNFIIKDGSSKAKKK